MIKNWKTTLAGLATLAMGAILIVIGQVPAGVICIPIGIGFLNTKDNNVTGGTIPVTDEAKDRVTEDKK